MDKFLIGIFLSYVAFKIFGNTFIQTYEAYMQTLIPILCLAIAISAPFLIVYYARLRCFLYLQKFIKKIISSILSIAHGAVLAYIWSMVYFFIIHEQSIAIVSIYFYLLIAESLSDALCNWSNVSLVKPYYLKGKDIILICTSKPNENKMNK